MELSNFEHLLQAARLQPEPQRLLLVFAGVELPDDATAEQRARFAAGQGGALVPRLCVDKAPQELASFAALVDEARALTAPGFEWALVFAAALSGRLNQAPAAAEVDQALERMVGMIKAGQMGAFVAFDTQGLPVQFG